MGGATVTASLTNGSSLQTGYTSFQLGIFIGTWVESGINTTTLSSTLTTLDSNIHAYWTCRERFELYRNIAFDNPQLSRQPTYFRQIGSRR